MEVLREPPNVSTFVPLAEHQSTTPASFYSGPPVLHYHSDRSKLIIAEGEIGKVLAFAPLIQHANPPQSESNGESEHAETAETQRVVDNVDIFVTSDKLLLFSSAAAAGVAIPYPTISLHAIQTLPAPSDSSDQAPGQGVYMQLITSTDDEEDVETMSITLVPTAAAPQQPEQESATADGGEDEDLATNDNEAHQSPAQALFNALSNCSNLHPDPVNQDDDNDNDEGAGGSRLIQSGLAIPLGSSGSSLPPPLPGSGGWITAENMHEFIDEDGNFIEQDDEEGDAVAGDAEGGDAPPLGPGAGTISFTFILPLFPSLLSFYRTLETSPTSALNRVLGYLNAYKKTFSIPVNEKYDIVLLGGALGSLFSLLQAVASPIIGRASDKYGRRTALLWSMTGNIASVALWCVAVNFRTFLLSRVVGGLSEGNVQLATAIATDISDESQRGSTMALVGACFSIAFTFGPALGAALANVTVVSANPFATAAGVSLSLICVETLYLYLYLPETKPAASRTKRAEGSVRNTPHTNRPSLLNLIHFLFLLPFSGVEFSLPFLIATALFPDHPSPSAVNGRVLGFIGLIASLLQGSVVRRLPPLTVVKTGVVSCAAAMFMLAQIQSTPALYAAAALLAVTSATVVTGLNSLGSFEAEEHNRGELLGALRSWGQLGRALGPLVFCSLFWWAGREAAYTIGGSCMLGVVALTFGLLQSPAPALINLAKPKLNGHAKETLLI
ncbi:hypothetical protein DV735_g311, partial [Chaetothyriales sp. CBS 134920]